MPSARKDYYKILQVDPAAEPEVIKAAYQRLAKKYHPDRNKSSDANRRMQEINDAYDVLGDPAKWDEYDRHRSAGHSRSDQNHDEDARRRHEAEAARRHDKEAADAAKREAEEERRRKEGAEAAQRRAREEQEQQAAVEQRRARTGAVLAVLAVAVVVAFGMLVPTDNDNKPGATSAESTAPPPVQPASGYSLPSPPSEGEGLPAFLKYYGTRLAPRGQEALGRKILAAYVQHVSDVNAFVSGHSLLAIAAEIGATDIAQELLQRGANPNFIGWTPLYAACVEGNYEIAKLLLDNGADVNQSKGDGWTPLLAVATSDDVELAQLLIDHGADVNAISPHGGSPYDNAMAARAMHTAELIRASGGRPHAPPGSQVSID